MHSTRRPLFTLLIGALAALGLTAAAPAQALAETQQKPIVLSWESLLPEGQSVATAPQSNVPAGDSGISSLFDDQTSGGISHDGGAARQFGSAEVVQELNGQYVRLPGFMLPLDYTADGAVETFLLVPYFGACIHVPPPPPNQIVYVDTMGEPVKSRGMWDAIWIIGTLRTEANINGVGDTAYTLELDRIETYED